MPTSTQRAISCLQIFSIYAFSFLPLQNMVMREVQHLFELLSSAFRVGRLRRPRLAGFSGHLWTGYFEQCRLRKRERKCNHICLLTPFFVSKYLSSRPIQWMPSKAWGTEAICSTPGLVLAFSKGMCIIPCYICCRRQMDDTVLI